MNRKYNPFVSLVALLLAAVILVLTCTGCAVYTAAETDTETRARFTYEYAGVGPCMESLYIITDNETGAQYLAWDSYDGAAMTALLPAAEEG